MVRGKKAGANAERDRAILEAHLSGTHTAELAELYQLSVDRILFILHAQGVPPLAKGSASWSAEKQEQASEIASGNARANWGASKAAAYLAAYDEGEKVADIAERFNVSRATVYGVIRARSGPPRSAAFLPEIKKRVAAIKVIAKQRPEEAVALGRQLRDDVLRIIAGPSLGSFKALAKAAVTTLEQESGNSA